MSGSLQSNTPFIDPIRRVQAYSHRSMRVSSRASLEGVPYLLEEASRVLADLGEARDDVVEVEVGQGGMVSALPLHLRQQQVPAVDRWQHTLLLPEDGRGGDGEGERGIGERERRWIRLGLDSVHFTDRLGLSFSTSFMTAAQDDNPCLLSPRIDSGYTFIVEIGAKGNTVCSWRQFLLSSSNRRWKFVFNPRVHHLLITPLPDRVCWICTLSVILVNFSLSFSLNCIQIRSSCLMNRFHQWEIRPNRLHVEARLLWNKIDM